MSGSQFIPGGPAAPRLASRPDLLGTSSLSGSVILVDLSGSMATCDDGGTLSRYARLTPVLWDTMRGAPQARLVTFGDQVKELVGFEPGDALPLPGGGTPMAAAFELIAPWRPSKVIVLSDGQPQEAQRVLAIARTLKPAIISALFIGSDNDKTGIAFMNALRLMGGRGGVSGHRSLAGPEATKALSDEIKLLLTGPAR